MCGELPPRLGGPSRCVAASPGLAFRAPAHRNVIGEKERDPSDLDNRLGQGIRDDAGARSPGPHGPDRGGARVPGLLTRPRRVRAAALASPTVGGQVPLAEPRSAARPMGPPAAPARRTVRASQCCQCVAAVRLRLQQLTRPAAACRRGVRRALSLAVALTGPCPAPGVAALRACTLRLRLCLQAEAVGARPS